MGPQKARKDKMEVDEHEEQNGHDEEEKLECDLSAYTLFHEGSTGSPCLSFDIIKDDLGENRNCETPVTCYFVAGSQASSTHLNSIVLLKMSKLQKVPESSNDDDESDDDEDDPVVHSAVINHPGCINRIRTAKFAESNLAASWSELGQVNIWDMKPMMDAVNGEEDTTNFTNVQPLYSFSGHGTEGFAVDWSTSMPGTLATGDCSKNIYIWKPEEGGKWSVGNKPFVGHTASVEDIQWSPNEQHVFASCSVDKSIRVWDGRSAPDKACKLTCENAHSKDVNVIHWNRNDPFIVSGGDDGQINVWDLRKFQSKTPVARLQHHNGPVCTVEWHPTDSSVLASGGEDDSVLQWDLAVEVDGKEEGSSKEEDIPQQLLFIHQGQKEVKEIHWHPQIQGLLISTAHSGFNIFKTISC